MRNLLAHLTTFVVLRFALVYKDLIQFLFQNLVWESDLKNLVVLSLLPTTVPKFFDFALVVDSALDSAPDPALDP